MKKQVLIGGFLLISITLFGQTRKSIFVEGLGNGLLISANFDMRIKADRNDGPGFRAGIGGGNASGVDSQGNSAQIGMVTFPLAFNYLIGKKRSSFESGIGITPVYITASGIINDDVIEGDGFTANGFVNIGYRYQPLRNGLMAKLNWSPSFNTSGFYPSWYGIGLGYSFK